MAFAVNKLIQEAAEDLSLVDDGDPVSGDLASSCEGLLNRAIADLNRDSYISLTVGHRDIVAAGSVYYKKLEEGEALPPNTVDVEPPDTIQGVSRKIGIRYMRLLPSNPEEMDRAITYTFPQMWSYGVVFETAPSGAQRRVGKVYLNGSYPTDLRIYENASLPEYRLGDMIYLSPLYYNLILYTLELKMIQKYKLYSYKAECKENLAGAMKGIDTNTAANRPMNSDGILENYGQPAADLLAGAGF